MKRPDRSCATFGHIASTTTDPERCAYCGEPVTPDARVVLIAAAKRLRAGDLLGALRLLEACRREHRSRREPPQAPPAPALTRARRRAHARTRRQRSHPPNLRQEHHMTTLDLDSLILATGSHSKRTSGVCLMEAVAWYAGEDHSDMPACVSLVLRGYGIRLNDRLPHERRQELKQFIPALIGTADDGRDDARRELASQVLMGEWLPAWLRMAKLDDLATQAEAGAGLTGDELARALRAIRDVTWKARRETRERLKVRIAEELRKQGKPAVAAAADAVAAAADAVADAVAVAVADAAAAAADAVAAAADAAAAAADAAADAVAVAVAVAAAADAVGAVAVAVADAAAAAADAVADAADPWGDYTAVYTAMRKHYETSPALAVVRALRDQQLDAAIALYPRLIEAG